MKKIKILSSIGILAPVLAIPLVVCLVAIMNLNSKIYKQSMKTTENQL